MQHLMWFILAVTILSLKLIFRVMSFPSQPPITSSIIYKSIQSFFLWDNNWNFLYSICFYYCVLTYSFKQPIPVQPTKLKSSKETCSVSGWTKMLLRGVYHLQRFDWQRANYHSCLLTAWLVIQDSFCSLLSTNIIIFYIVIAYTEHWNGDEPNYNEI